MANLLSIVNQQQAPIDKEKLRIFYSKQNVWEHCGIDRYVFLIVSRREEAQIDSRILLR